MPAAPAQKFERIAVEEGFSIPEILAEQAKLRERPSAPSAQRQAMFRALVDLGEERIRAMDEDGIAKQLLVLSAPGVQMFETGRAGALAILANDRLAQAVAAHPDRLAGLAAVAPQDPAGAARELERAVKKLGLKGAIINSHTNGEYLDDRKFWPIFEAAQAMDVPIYIHPRDPPPQMAAPLDILGFHVGWGYGVEVGTHVLRLIGAGVFDQFPHLRIVIGHMGEGIPFCLERIDNRFVWEHEIAGLPARLKRLPSAYVRDNITVTTSGMNFTEPLLLAVKLLGADNVLFAADYPFEVARDAVSALDSIALSLADKEKIYHRNAKRVFAL